MIINLANNKKLLKESYHKSFNHIFFSHKIITLMYMANFILDGLNRKRNIAKLLNSFSQLYESCSICFIYS